MKRTILVLVVMLLAALLSTAPLASAAGSQPPDRDALRTRIQERFDVVPITGGIALTPKTRRADVRLVEVSDAIAINGTVVSGRELRERLGSDAEAILQLSYLDEPARRALFARSEAASETPRREERGSGRRGDIPEDRRRSRSSYGDRVRVFGNVTVGADEEINGQAVAVFGSVRVDGVVHDQVVAVFGTVELGPNAIIRGDVVSVGGQVRRSSGSEVRGGVTEVSVGRVDIPHEAMPWLAGVGLYSLGDGLVGVPRLVGSTFRLLLLIILATLAYLIARRSVENAAERIRENPTKATFIGLSAALLIGPLLFIVTIVLILTVIGIPLLVLMPVMLVFLVLMGLAGFSGSAYAIGQWASRRFGIGSGAGAGTVVLGVIVILLPVMLARIIGLGGWATTPIAWPMSAIAFFFELLVWCAGFGAVVSNTLSGWQARRAARAVPVAPAQ